jgi:hypothetical protein
MRVNGFFTMPNVKGSGGNPKWSENASLRKAANGLCVFAPLREKNHPLIKPYRLHRTNLGNKPCGQQQHNGHCHKYH